MSEIDLERMEGFIKVIAPGSGQSLRNDIRTRGRKDAVRETFPVEFRNAWEKVRDNAIKMYESSDFTYFHEFMAVVTGKVDPAGYKKSPSKH